MLNHYFDTGNYTISGKFSGSNDEYPAGEIISGLLRVNVKNSWFIGDVGYETIYEAVEAAEIGDVIKGLPGTYIIDETVDIGHRYMPIEPWEVIKSVTITSMGDEPVTLKADNTRLFYVDDGSELTLKNLILCDGNGEYKDGTAVETMTGTNLTVDNCTFINNTGERGGALFIWGDAVIKNSIFKENHATSVGGAIYVLSSETVEIDNCKFIENDAVSYGGAIYYYGSYLSDALINNSEFTSNTGLRGGALFNGYGNVTIDNALFKDNMAVNPEGYEITSIGGAIYTSSSSNTFVSNSDFINNYAEDNGGAADIDCALYISWSSTDELNHYHYYWATFDNCKFINNSAGGAGGALLIGEEHVACVNVTNSIFDNNQAFLEGAAIVSTYSYLTIEDSTFTNNKDIGNDNLIYISGVYNSEAFESVLEIYNVTFNNNDVDYDIYLANEYAVLELYGAVFDGEKVPVYNKGKATVQDAKETNSLGADYSIYNAGSLYLKSNEFENPIYNKAYIDSPTYVVVLNNETVKAAAGESYELFAVVTDDNGNIIEEGNLVFLVDEKEIPATYKNLQHVANYVVTAGIHEVGATYDDTGLVDLSIKKGTVEAMASPNLAVKANNIQFGEEALIVISIDSKATDNVSVKVNGEVYNVAIKNGLGSVSIPGLAPGKYLVEASYPGDENFSPDKANATLTVSKVSDYTFEANISDAVAGEDVVINITLPEDATKGVFVTVNDKSYYSTIKDGKAQVTISGLDKGNYPVVIKYPGDSKYAESTINDSINVVESIVVIAPDVEKFYGGSERFYVTVLSANAPVSNQNVIININGVDYTRTTNASGVASIALGLNSGNYSVVVTVNDTKVNASVIVKSTVEANDLVKVFRNESQFYATFYDTEGNLLKSGTVVSFNINGVFYNRTVGDKGTARLNINLEQGNYTITSINTITGENHANNVEVIPRIVENRDVDMFYRNGTKYEVRLIGDDGKPVGAGETVTFNINGVFYNRTTDENGYARLNLNLQPGNYIITAEYKNCRVSNNITIKPVLYANNLEMSYKDGSQFEAKLVNGQGNPFKGENVTFNINGVFYERTTDADGIARLNINLMSGEYIITSSYNDANIANKITIH